MDKYRIIVDTREQKPLFTGKSVVVKKLDTGDYSIEGFEDKIALERKEPLDLFQTLTHGHKRFKKELERALKLDYFALIVETNLVSVEDKSFDGAFYTKMKGFVILKIVFTLHMKYGVNVFFVNGRREAKRLVRYLFNAYINNK